MEVAPRTINMRIFCHSCQNSFNKLINPDDTSGIFCEKCKGEFVEILDKNKTVPHEPTAPSEPSPTRHGRYSSLMNNPQVLSHLANQPVMPPGPAQTYIHIERRPGGFTYIATGPGNSLQFQILQSSDGSAEEDKEVHSEDETHTIQWHEQMLNRHFPAYMSNFMQDVQTMNWDNSIANDPFSSNFMDGLVFGRGFPSLRLNDFFSEADNFHPTNLGINLQDFGMNFASNFRRGNLIDLIQLISMGDQGSSGKPPASKEVVSKLPVFKIEKKHCKKNTEGKLEIPNCAVCCNDINLGENAQLIPCGHMFHPNCIKPWFMEHNTCPICRYELPTDDPYYEEIRKRDLQQRQEQRSGHT